MLREARATVGYSAIKEQKSVAANLMAEAGDIDLGSLNGVQFQQSGSTVSLGMYAAVTGRLREACGMKATAVNRRLGGAFVVLGVVVDPWGGFEDCPPFPKRPAALLRTISLARATASK